MNNAFSVPIPGTERCEWPGTTFAAPIDSEADVVLTAWLRPRAGGDLDADRARALASQLPAERRYDTRARVRDATAADPHDIERLRAYCASFGIRVVGAHWRSVTLSGSLSVLIAAFGADVAIYETSDGRRFRLRTNALNVPAAIAEIVRGVFGLHQWPRSHKIGALKGVTVPLNAAEIAAHYAFPDGDGSGQTIGVLQLRGTFTPADFTDGMRAQGVTAALPTLKRIDNAERSHQIETVKDIESAIDTQVVGQLAPGARIVIYAAPDDERGVLDAISAAIFDDEHAPSILSISFGFPEYLWTPAALVILDDLFTVAALVGVTVICASGDNGAELDAAGNAHVLAPASSPFALACGGTTIAPDGGEAAWDQSGGGFSAAFPIPPWQQDRPMVGGRGVPDVAAQSRPGYAVSFDGVILAMGGTSAAAPLWAALVARINERLGRNVGCMTPLLYAAPPNTALRDVRTGASDRYAAQAGWDPLTGLGVPTGDACVVALAGRTPTN